MACNCGAEAAASRRARIMSAVARQPKGGNFPLSGEFEGCTTLYPADGQHAGNSIYIVGRGTTLQRLFPRNALADVSAYAREVRMQIENVPTTSLCAAAVEAVLS